MENNKREFLLDTIKLLTIEKFCDNLVNKVLINILDFYDASRVRILNLNYDNNQISVIHEQRKNLFTSDTLFNMMPLDSYKLICEALTKENSMYYIDDVEQFSNDIKYREEYEWLQNNSINSFVAIPARKNGNITDLIILDNPKKNQQYFEEICLLAIIFKSKEEEAKIRKRLETFSFIDDLTKLKNKNAYNLFISETKNKILKKTGVLFADLNSLKFTNDKFGHQQGDKLIKYMAEFLKKYFPNDNVFRISGDEFVAYYENVEKLDFINLVNKLRSDIQTSSPNLASMGAYWEEDVNDVRQNIFFAEQKMYAEKRVYHNQYSDELTNEVKDDSYVKAFLAEIRNDTFTFFLHPVFDSKSGKIVCAEALSRRITKDNKVIQPFEYIPFLKKEHLIVDFEFEFLALVFAYICDCNKKNVPLVPLKFVLSDQTLLSENFIERFEKLQAKYGVKKNQIILTLTVLPSDKARQAIYDVVKYIHNSGIKVVVETIVGEYDNFEWALAEGIDGIVFSRNIMTRLNIEPKASIVLDDLIKLAKKLNIRTILRGVENEEQLELYKSFNADYLQGYYFDKPMNQKDFNEKYLNIK